MRHQTTPHLLALSRGAGAVAVVAALVGCGARTGVAAIAPADATPTSAHSATPGHAATPTAHSATTLAHSVTATRTGTSRSSAGVATDRRIAADGRLHLSDFPDGTAADATYVYAGAGTASHWFSALTTRGTVACQVRYFRTALTALGRADGVTVGPIRSGRLELPVGDQHAATRITIQLFDFGATVHAAVDLVYVRVGRALAAFALVGIESPFDPTLERTLVKTVTDRLAADLRASS